MRSHSRLRRVSSPLRSRFGYSSFCATAVLYPYTPAEPVTQHDIQIAAGLAPAAVTGSGSGGASPGSAGALEGCDLRVGARTVNGRHLPAHGSQVGAELAAVVRGVPNHQREEPTAGS